MTEHGAGRGQTSVSGLRVVAPLVFEVVEKAGDVGRGDGAEIERFRGNVERGGQVLQQHSPGVAVGADRVRGKVALGGTHRPVTDQPCTRTSLSCSNDSTKSWTGGPTTSGTVSLSVSLEASTTTHGNESGDG